MYQAIRTSIFFILVFLLTTVVVSVSTASTPADAYWETKYYHAGVQGIVNSMLSQPGAHKREAEIPHVYGREEAHEVIERSRKDYGEKFGELKKLFESLKTG